VTFFSSFSFRRLLLIGSSALLANYAIASNQDTNEIAARIAPVGKVCVEGQDCQKVAAATQVAATSDSKEYTGRAPEKIYHTYCIACHSSGAAGAPRLGNVREWQPHIAKGMDTLVKHAINGLGAMPPKGFCADCSDEELAQTTQYMVDKSK